MFMGQALASTLDDEELADLRDQFDAIDVDKNGLISLDEMRHVSSIYMIKHRNHSLITNMKFRVLDYFDSIF